MYKEVLFANLSTSKIKACIEAFEAKTPSLDLMNIHFLIDTEEVKDTVEALKKELADRERLTESLKVWHDEF